MESTEIPAITGGSPEMSKGGEGAVTRKEKRKALKKLKRKQLRREMAIKEKELEEARANDPEEQIRLKKLEEEERERIERDRREFEERERIWLEAKKKRDEEEEAERHRKLLEESEAESKKKEEKLEEDEEFEYIEEGPAEIIWKGNEIIVKKKKVKVPKKSIQNQPIKQELERPISNPFPPNSESSNSNSAQEILEKISQENPNFGTEQDKANCPFQIKTGACRFGTRCTRLHFYPEKSHTLLIKNMYSGPGLAFDQDEGLEKIISRSCEDLSMELYPEYTDEEIERSYEEFYEDVHTEFLKYGELVNFKVCRNGSYHLRGNVYVHYKSLDSAIIAYNNINGRFFAGKMITCEFVGVTKWKVAICGEFMKSRLKTCSRGNSCNFIHCFRNPGGDYEWADFDKPPPNSWIRKMASLFGFSDQSYCASKALDSEWSGTPTNDRYGSRSRRDDYDFERRREYSHSRERNYDDYDLERRREYSHSRERNYERHRSSSIKNEDRSKNDSKDRKREDEDKNNYNLKEQKRENKDKNKNSSKEQKREYENKLEIKRKRKEEKMEVSIQEERYKGGVSPKDDIYLKNEYCEIKSRREKHRECSEDFVERESTHKKSKRKHDRKNGKEKHDYDYNYDSEESEYSERREGNNDYDDGYDNYDYREYKRSKKDLSEDKSSSRRKI